MKNFKIHYSKEFTSSPATYWVHIEQEAFDGFKETTFRPPIPKPVKGLGYAVFTIEFQGLKLVFSSFEEIQHYIEILSKKNLPTTISLAKKRDRLTPIEESVNPERSRWIVGPNKHWLSRLPAKCKAWKFREGLVKYLSQSLTEFKKEIKS